MNWTRRMGGAGLKVLAGLLLIAGSINAYVEPVWAERVLLDRVVAVVNGEVITWSQLRGFIPPDAMAAARASGERAAERVSGLESQYLEQMVELRLQAQAAEAEGVSVSDSEVEQAVTGIREKYGLDEEGLADALDDQGLTLESYRSNLKEQILVNRVVNKVIRPRVTVSDADVDRVMAVEHPEFAHRNIAARVRLISLDDGETEEARNLAQDIIRQFREETPFSDLATRYSADPSAKFGGDLGVIRRGMIKPALESAAFALDPGQISEPLLLEGRIYLLVVDSYEEQSGDIAAARREVVERLRNKAMEKEYLAWLRQLKGKAYVEIKLN